MMNKRYMMLLFVLWVTLIVSGCGKGAGEKVDGAEKKEKVLNLKSADVVSSKSPYTAGMHKFSEEMKDATNGKMNIKHFPDGQLGNDGAILESVKIGTIDMAVTGSSGYEPMDTLMYLPYLFEDSEHMWKVLHGELGQKIIEDYEENTEDIKLIGFAYFAPRVLTTKGVEVRKPEDLKGLKVRVPEDEMMIETWKALGATPTPIAFTELFTSLQSGVVNGQENPYEIIENNSFHEVQDTVIETYHSIPVRFFIMNKARYNSLSPEEQQLIHDKWKEAASYIEKLYKEQDEEYMQTLKDKGMKFIEPDVDAFREATKDIWKKYVPQTYGEGFYEEIQSLR